MPVEFHVYHMKGHYSDEGGPREYVPLLIMKQFEEERRDESLWPRVFRSALEHGVAIEVAPDHSRMYRDGRTPMADISQWGRKEDHLLILTERANAALAPFLRGICQPVPVSCKDASLFGYHLEAVEDVLDVGKCKGDWDTYAGRKTCTNILEYSIRTEKLGRSPLFRVLEDDYRVLVLKPVVDAVEQNALTGFRFERVWPHTTIRPVVTIEVKKLPPSAAYKREEPTLTVAETEVSCAFLGELLGSPLVHGDGVQFDLFGYRLRDLSLPSGSIVAADLMFGEGRPFERRVSPGKYPLTLIAARSGKEAGSDERIALALLRFNHGPVARWEIATTVSGRGKPRKSYGVDSGSGGFCDAQAQEVLLDLVDPMGSFNKRLEKEMAKSYRHTRSWVHLETSAGSAAVFSSGYGDGQYRSYWGLGDSGDMVALLTDFGVLEWPRRPE